MSSQLFNCVSRVVGPADCFPEDVVEEDAHLVTVGGLPLSLVHCPRCYRPLVQVALLPLSLTCIFGGREPWPIFICPSEDNNQLISYTVQDGEVTIVDYLHGTLADPEFEPVVLAGQKQAQVELREIRLKQPGRFDHLLMRAQSALTQSDLFALDEDVTSAWLSEYRELPNLVDMGQWPEMLFGSIPLGMIRLSPGSCPLTGQKMTAVGLIANPVCGLVWSSIFLDTLRVSYCTESTCLTVTGGFNPDLVWAQ